MFLDRDGTMCREVNYLSRPEDLALFPFSGRAIRLLNEKKYLVIVITNQSGIGRGYFDEQTLEKIHHKLIRELNLENAFLDAIYFCPHGPADKCLCRKPGTGLIERACADFEIDLKNSWVIGDKASDIETGYNTGSRTALVQTGYGREEIKKLLHKPDLAPENLFEAVLTITENL